VGQLPPGVWLSTARREGRGPPATPSGDQWRLRVAGSWAGDLRGRSGDRQVLDRPGESGR